MRTIGAPVRPVPGQWPRTEVALEGSAKLYHFAPAPGVARVGRTPVLLASSLINRWYVLDLYPEGSIVRRLVEAGLDVWAIDWGVPTDDDRWLRWDDLVRRLERGLRKVRQLTGASKSVLLGYSIAGTLAVIAAARNREPLAGLVNLAGPVDFSKAGLLQRLTDPRWFDVDAIAEAGNVEPAQMLAGFLALRPTSVLGDMVKLAQFAARKDKLSRDHTLALSGWAYDNIPFVGEAYRDYVRSLYQRNELVRGEHQVHGKPVILSDISCPVLSIVADRDVITPPASALALHDHLAGRCEVLEAQGGHVSAIVHPSGREGFHRSLCAWLEARVRQADEVG